MDPASAVLSGGGVCPGRELDGGGGGVCPGRELDGERVFVLAWELCLEFTGIISFLQRRIWNRK